MWQLTGGQRESLIGSIRTIVVRLARAMGGGVEFWLELPIYELLKYALELSKQVQAEAGKEVRV